MGCACSKSQNRRNNNKSSSKKSKDRKQQSANDNSNKDNNNKLDTNNDNKQLQNSNNNSLSEMGRSVVPPLLSQHHVELLDASSSTANMLSLSQQQQHQQSITNRQSMVQSNKLSKLNMPLYKMHQLPLRTQFLLNGLRHYDNSLISNNQFVFDLQYREANNKLENFETITNSLALINLLNQNNQSNQTDTTQSHTKAIKINRHVQVYLSVASSISKSSSQNADHVNKILTSLNSKSTVSNNSTQTLFSHLKSYCAQQINNLDLNLIDLNGVELLDKEVTQTSMTDSLKFTNCYFRRFLSKLLLNDLLCLTQTPFLISSMNSSAVSSNSYNYYSSSYSLFVIYLSDLQFETEAENDNNPTSSLLLPEHIDLDDFKQYIEPYLQNDNSLAQLYKKYYKNNYILALDYLNFNENVLCELQHLLEGLIKIFNNQSNTDEENSETSISLKLKLKYLKSWQQEEIEIIAKYADPTSIIWIHLIDNSTNKPGILNIFNQKRYASLLDTLQSQVSKHNYKKVNLFTQPPAQDEPFVKQQLNDFLYSSIKQLIDSFLVELNKTQINTQAIKIDKRLSQELYKHYQIVKYLTKNNGNKIKHVDNHKQKLQEQFDSSIASYLSSKENNSKQSLVFVLSDYDSSMSSSLMATWLNSKMSNEDAADESQCHIYRFSNKTLSSTHLKTLLQNILHQLTYLLECHESYAFSHDLLSTNKHFVELFCQIFQLYKQKQKQATEQQQQQPIPDSQLMQTIQLEQIVILIDRVDEACANDSDIELLNEVIDKLNEHELSTLVKLVLTVSDHSKLNQQNIKVIHLETGQSLSSTKKLNEYDKYISDDYNPSDQNSILNLIRILLVQSRYGLKECELIDLIKGFTLKHHSSKNSDYLDYNILLTWYAIKYMNKLFGMHLNTLNDSNNQTLYKLKANKLSKKVSSPALQQITSQFVFNYYCQLLNNDTKSFYISQQQQQQKPSCISYLYSRCFHELLAYSPTPHQNLTNLNYLLNKLVNIGGNCVYLLHDFDLSHQENSELNEFKKCLYKCFYALYQDPNQMQQQLIYLNHSNDLIRKLASQLVNVNSQQPKLIPFQQETISLPQLSTQIKAFNLLNPISNQQKVNYFTSVKFLSDQHVLAMSEITNEIRVYKIDCNKEDKCTLIRSISLNKPPRDLRLFNKSKAVVLVERNLHLFDLDTCTHLLDLNSTMNPNFPFFEIHDQNHVVLLARNRLSVILMKVPFDKLNELLQNCQQNNASDLNERIKNVKIMSDDMFLFKVGEDRYLESLLVSRNGQVMVCGDAVQKPFPLLVWNLDQRKLVYDLRQAKHEFITSIQSIGSSGRYVVCACQEEGESNNCLIVYDLTTGQLTKKLKAKFNYVSVELSEESSIIIACLENAQIIIYDLNNGSKKFTLNSNRYPINKIKIFDQCQKFKNFFLTYDTTGQDWTIRLWDITKGDTLISSFTCPSRIISLDDNLQANQQQDELLLAIGLYGYQSLILLKLAHTNGASSTVDMKKISVSLNEDKNKINNVNDSSLLLFSNENLINRDIKL